ncbi:hypothetical protein EMIT0P253_340058 [Pseudomonas sp. IT-P253]
MNYTGFHTRSLNWQRRREGIVQALFLQPSRAVGDYVVSHCGDSGDEGAVAGWGKVYLRHETH